MDTGHHFLIIKFKSVFWNKFKKDVIEIFLPYIHIPQICNVTAWWACSLLSTELGSQLTVTYLCGTMKMGMYLRLACFIAWLEFRLSLLKLVFCSFEAAWFIFHSLISGSVLLSVHTNHLGIGLKCGICTVALSKFQEPAFVTSSGRGGGGWCCQSRYQPLWVAEV